MNLVSFTGTETFVALSYMWPINDVSGQLTKTNLSELQTVNGLQKVPLPNIVSDAIALCRALKQRYLWIDRLCIVQDDDHAKMRQISHMDSIYLQATLTIMAALNCRNASEGIVGCPKMPGCPGRPRLRSALRPAREYTEGRSSETTTDAAVNASLWDHRGWTFQERMLSRRRLFITEFQVMFACGDTVAYEEYARPLNHGDPTNDRVGCSRGPRFHRQTHTANTHEQGYRSLGWRSASSAHFDIMEQPVGLQEYAHIVGEYTKRTLSVRSDILKAFYGVSNMIRRHMDTDLIHGLPVKHLHYVLQWQVDNPPVGGWDGSSTSEEGDDVVAPSWSWASTDHPVEFLDQGFRPNWSLISFYYQLPLATFPDTTLSLRKIHDPQPIEHADFSFLPETLSRNEATAFRDFASAIPTQLDQNMVAISRSLPSSLVFNTTAAMCRREDTVNDFNRPLLKHASNGKRVGQILSRDPTWWRACENGRLLTGALIKAVVIAGTRPDYRAATEEEDRLALTVLLVEPDPDEPLAIRRIGLGEVYLDEWQSCNPRWETVVLN